MKKILIFFAMILSLSSYAEKDNIDVTIKLSSMGDDVAFDKTAIQVPFSKKITLHFLNKASHDSEITHNVAIVVPGKEKELLALMDTDDYEHDEHTDLFASKKYANLILAKTKILAPGKVAKIDFYPPKPGNYTYICLIPGHGNGMNMKGVLRVAKVAKEKPKKKSKKK